MDQFSQNNRHTTLILKLLCLYGHSATVILNFVSESKPLCKMSGGPAMTRKCNRPPPGYPCSF